MLFACVWGRSEYQKMIRVKIRARPPHAEYELPLSVKTDFGNYGESDMQWVLVNKREKS